MGFAALLFHRHRDCNSGALTSTGGGSVSRGSRPSGASGRERRGWLPLPCEAAGRFEDKGDIGGIESIDEPVEFVDLWVGS